MDEPTANLDFGNQAILYSIIQELQTKGKTILFTTHNPNHVMELNCDTIGMKDGSVIYKGAAKEILSIESIKKLYGNNFIVKYDGNFFSIRP